MFDDLNVIFQANTTKELNKYITAMEISIKQKVSFVRTNKCIPCGNNSTKITYSKGITH